MRGSLRRRYHRWRLGGCFGEGGRCPCIWRRQYTDGVPMGKGPDGTCSGVAFRGGSDHGSRGPSHGAGCETCYDEWYFTTRESHSALLCSFVSSEHAADNSPIYRCILSQERNTNTALQNTSSSPSMFINAVTSPLTCWPSLLPPTYVQAAASAVPPFPSCRPPVGFTTNYANTHESPVQKSLNLDFSHLASSPCHMGF